MTEQSAVMHPNTLSPITLREMTADDLPACHGLSQQVSWPHRLEDWQLALHCGKGWVAEAEGKVVGSAIYWQWGSDYATLGLVIVSPECQGRGIGKQLLLTLTGKLDGSIVRLHATPEGRPLYEKLGFVATGEIRQQQSRELPAIAPPELTVDEALRALNADDVAKMTALDAQSSGMQRGILYQALGDPTSAMRMVKGLMLTRDGEPAGFAMLREFGRGYALGPVITQNVQDAQKLIAQLLHEIPGQFVRLDVEADSGLAEWLDTLGLTCVDSPTTMYKDGAPLRASNGWRNLVLATQAMG